LARHETTPVASVKKAAKAVGKNTPGKKKIGKVKPGEFLEYYQGDAYEELPGGLMGKTVPSSSFQSGTHSSDTSEDSDFDPEKDTCGSSGSVPNYHVLEPEDNSIWMCKKLLATLASGLLIKLIRVLSRHILWADIVQSLIRSLLCICT
jgi:hypothetical protein